MQNIHRIIQYNPRDINTASVNQRTSAIHMWPAKKHCVFDGWVLRFLNPYTYRCNCIYPLKKGAIEIASKIQQCASIYQQMNYKYLFQIMPQDGTLDLLLHASGYQKTLTTRWMAIKLNTLTEYTKKQQNCVVKLSKNWSENRREIAGYSELESSIYMKFYEAINLQTYPMVLFVDQYPVSCGLGIQVNRYLGIFDVRTKKEFQRQGYASILIQSICKHAVHNGANSAQLHVSIENHAAIHMYHQLGFQTICDYWFRKKNKDSKDLKNKSRGIRKKTKNKQRLNQPGYKGPIQPKNEKL